MEPVSHHAARRGPVRRGWLPSALLVALALVSAGAGAPQAHADGGPLGAKPPEVVARPAESGGLTAGLPPSVDLSALAPPPGDQVGVNSCVAWVVSHGLMGFYARKYGSPETDFAPMYLYAQVNSGGSERDAGAYPAVALEKVSFEGNDTRAHYAHPDDDWRTQPNADERANARNYRLSGYSTLFSTPNGAGSNGARQIRTSLAAGSPVAIGLRVREGFDA